MGLFCAAISLAPEVAAHGCAADDSYQAQASQQLNNQGYSRDDDPSKLQELIAGGAAFEAAKSWEDHETANGKVENHSTAKELLAGFAGAAADRWVQTTGMDFIDKERAKRDAADQCQDAYASQRM